ncbi:MAG: hypothetical protein ABIK84_00175 [candidate division WOR-3 bacterium]
MKDNSLFITTSNPLTTTFNYTNLFPNVKVKLDGFRLTVLEMEKLAKILPDGEIF